MIEKGKRKLGLSISILFNLGILAGFKYLNFAFDNLYTAVEFIGFDPVVLGDIPQIALPIGISFYTFQTMSYTIDVYRGNVKANRNFLEFATYVTMFPQLVAGPIVRYSDIHQQLSNRTVNLSLFSEGVERFIIGLAKKVLIANTFALITDGIFAQDFNDLSTWYAWVGIIAYSIQIYFDFSGYSDMAIGLGKMLGFNFPENFNFPYIARSIREFWQRWHISLSTWFRDYVYISLGGNRSGSLRTYINLAIVFFVTGLWHGASWNFVVWGLFHGTFLVVERMGLAQVINKAWRPIQHTYTILIALIGWVFFRADDLPMSLIYLKRMFVFNAGNESVNSYLHFYHINEHTLLFFVLAVAFSTPIYPLVKNRLTTSGCSWIIQFSLISLFVFTVIYLSAGSYNPFIYFRF